MSSWTIMSEWMQQHSSSKGRKKKKEMPQLQNHQPLSTVCHILTSLYLSGWMCWHAPCSWYMGTANPAASFLPTNWPLPFLTTAEDTGLMRTAYLHPVHPIVDMNRYPCNQNILLLLPLTLVYMGWHLYPLQDKQLLSGVGLCVFACGCL